MKTLLICLVPVWAFSQIAVTDSFSDGDFYRDPQWSGADSIFEVTLSRLHLSADGAGDSYLSSQSEIIDEAEWQFYVHLDFNPSSANYARVYLTSDHQDISGDLNGYFVQIGDRDDKLGLYRQSGSQTFLLAESAAGYLNMTSVIVRVKVTKDERSAWTLLSDTGNVIDPWTDHGTSYDTVIQSSAFFGVYCKYTATRSDKFYFDDFLLSGYKYVDIISPEADTIYATASTDLELLFNENIDNSAADLHKFEVSRGIGKPIHAEVTGKRLSLRFNNKFQPYTKYNLRVSEISDISGNTFSDTLDFEVSDQRPFIDLIHLRTDSTLEILFSEEMSKMLSNSYLILNDTSSPVRTEADELNAYKWHLVFNPSTFETGKQYKLTMEKVEDLFGNELADTLHFTCRELSLRDDFSDSSLANDVIWSGTEQAFKINERGQMQLAAEEEGFAYLSTASRIMEDAYWYFAVEMDFNPSASNYSRVYLASDKTDLSVPLNGYFVQLGSGNRRVGLYRQTGSVVTAVIESGEDILNTETVKARVMVNRSPGGKWTMSLDTGFHMDPLRKVGNGYDTVHAGSFFFGVYARYTSTRSDKFFFDDFYLSGNAYTEKVIPEIDSVNVLSDSILEVIFSEAVTRTSAADISYYQVDQDIGLPVSAEPDDHYSRRVKLVFDRSFERRRPYRIYVRGVEDLYSNKADDSAEFVFFTPAAGDIIINEVMPDPSPPVGLAPDILPEEEYLELYNRSGFAINLKMFDLQIGNRSFPLPSYVLGKGDYVVVVNKQGLKNFTTAGFPALGTDISPGALGNNEGSVALTSPEGYVISDLYYRNSWYGNKDKAGGGWALERVDPDNLCGGSHNWRPSESKAGGTPGRENSVKAENPDTVNPLIERVALLGDSGVELYFSKYLDPLEVGNKEIYHFQPAVSVKAVLPHSPHFTSVKVFLNQSLHRDTIYHFWFGTALADCNRNTLEPDTLAFSLPSVPRRGDILINEVLFDPFPRGSDFVELYNNSDKYFDLKDLRLANYDRFAKMAVNAVEISGGSYLFPPGSYVALSNDPEALHLFYTIKNPLQLIKPMGSLPSMPDDEGSIAVSLPNLKCVDHFEYEDDYHLPVIKDPEGISLERISFTADSTENNWQSAASTVGFATPAYENSQYFRPEMPLRTSVMPKVFSPDQDGYKDVISLYYNFEKPNYVLSISIWNSEGIKIREIMDQYTVSQEGFAKWDGTADNGLRLNSGIYIIVFDFFHESGTNGRLKETCVLSL